MRGRIVEETYDYFDCPNCDYAFAYEEDNGIYCPNCTGTFNHDEVVICPKCHGLIVQIP